MCSSVIALQGPVAPVTRQLPGVSHVELPLKRCCAIRGCSSCTCECRATLSGQPASITKCEKPLQLRTACHFETPWISQLIPQTFFCEMTCEIHTAFFTNNSQTISQRNCKWIVKNQLWRYVFCFADFCMKTCSASSRCFEAGGAKTLSNSRFLSLFAKLEIALFQRNDSVFCVTLHGDSDWNVKIPIEADYRQHKCFLHFFARKSALWQDVSDANAKMESRFCKIKKMIEGVFPIFSGNAFFDLSKGPKNTKKTKIRAGSAETAWRGPLATSSRRVLSHHLWKLWALFKGWSLKGRCNIRVYVPVCVCGCFPVCVCVCVCVCVPPLPPTPAHTVGLNSRIPPAPPHDPSPPFPHPYPQAIARPTPGKNYPLKSALKKWSSAYFPFFRETRFSTFQKAKKTKKKQNSRWQCGDIFEESAFAPLMKTAAPPQATTGWQRNFHVFLNRVQQTVSGNKPSQYPLDTLRWTLFRCSLRR